MHENVTILPTFSFSAKLSCRLTAASLRQFCMWFSGNGYTQPFRFFVIVSRTSASTQLMCCSATRKFSTRNTGSFVRLPPGEMNSAFARCSSVTGRFSIFSKRFYLEHSRLGAYRNPLDHSVDLLLDEINVTIEAELNSTVLLFQRVSDDPIEQMTVIWTALLSVIAARARIVPNTVTSSLNTVATKEHLECRPPPGGRSGMSSLASCFSSSPYSISFISARIVSMRWRRCASTASSRRWASSVGVGAPGNAMMMMLMLSRLPLCRQVSITWFATSTRLSDSWKRLCTNWHSSVLLITSHTPSHASTTNSSAGSRSRQKISGSGETSCSHCPSADTFL
uniref:Uncharacterized protein n=1 Tax=Anopheles atroparvus TaxID=41427 RepID=A0A182JBV4_ANOAO